MTFTVPFFILGPDLFGQNDLLREETGPSHFKNGPIKIVIYGIRRWRSGCCSKTFP